MYIRICMEVYLRRNIQGKKIKDGVWLEWRKRERLETVREREREITSAK